MRYGRDQNIITRNMHHIFSNKILHIPESTEPGFVFRYIWPMTPPWPRTPSSLSIWCEPCTYGDFHGLSEDGKKALVAFHEAFHLKTNQNMDLSFGTLALHDFFDSLRDLYKKLGYYNETLRTFYIPQSTSPVSLELHLQSLLYEKARWNWNSSCVRDAIRALNDGIVSRVSIDSLTEAKTDIESYLSQSHASPLRLAAAMEDGWSVCDFQDNHKEREKERPKTKTDDVYENSWNFASKLHLIEISTPSWNEVLPE